MTLSIGRLPTRLALAAALAVAACSDEGTTPADLRFGQIGRVTIEVSAPRDASVLARGVGELTQTLTWSSDGPWQRTERISYRGRLGDETVSESHEDPVVLARRYASWIAIVNDQTPVQLFLGEVLNADFVPVCADQSRVTVRIVDTQRRDSIAWTRCGEGSLLSPASELTVAPNQAPPAARVVQAAILARDFTVGRDFESAYTGTLPFATIDRGEQSRTPLLVPRVIEDQATWASFWAQHTAGASQPPAVDFTRDLVFVAAVGTRGEAGDSVEVRGVLPVATGTQVSLWERRPGNFCTPAPRSHAPYHVVFAPRGTPQPIFFSVAGVDQVPCG